MALPGGPGPAGTIVQHHHRTGRLPAPHPPTQPQTRARAQDPRKASAFDVFKFTVKCVSLRVSYCSYNGQHCYHLHSSKHPFLADTRPLGRLRDPTGLPRRPRSPSQPPLLLMSPNLPVHPASCRLPGQGAPPFSMPHPGPQPGAPMSAARTLGNAVCTPSPSQAPMSSSLAPVTEVGRRQGQAGHF